MKLILSHFASITSCRDHHQLDIAVLTAFEEMVGTREARIFDIHRANGNLMLRLRLALKDGTITPPPQLSIDLEHVGDPITQFPALQSCIEHHLTVGHDVAPDGSCILWLPIWMEDSVHTCLALTAAVPFDDPAMALIKSLVDVYANYQSLLDYSQRDSLTNLLNRKTFDENFSKMVTTLPPQDDPALKPASDRRHGLHAREHWLAVVDIDHFKKVNDAFGHLYGDEVLILVANLLRSSFRSHDLIFRFGGEEFVILLRAVTIQEARRIFERFRSNVEKHVFPQVGRVTVSLGFSSINDDTPVVILGHADQALYYAKEHGRNQVCFYDALVESGLLQSQVSNDSVEFF